MTIAVCREVRVAQHVRAPSRAAGEEFARRNVLARWRVAFQQGKVAWGGVPLEYEEFIAHVQELGYAEIPSHPIELYLAAACRLGRSAAFKALDDGYIERLRVSVKRVVRDASLVDDILQDVRCRLLVGSRARIADYRGTGPLISWMRVIAVNIAKDHLRARAKRRRREDGQRSQLMSENSRNEVPDGEMAQRIIHQGHVGACSEAVRRAFQALSPEKGRLLHDYFFGQLSIDLLGAMHGVNRATIARRIHKSTEEIRSCVRRSLASSFPRENARILDGVALAVCRELMVGADVLLGEHTHPGERAGIRTRHEQRADSRVITMQARRIRGVCAHAAKTRVASKMNAATGE
jgi:RNA polymerase sigma-70 factor